jgi:hypothetical protein
MKPGSELSGHELSTVGNLGRDWKLSLLTVGARTLFASASRARAQDHGKSQARPCDPAQKGSRSVTSLRQVGRQLKGDARRRSARPRAARLTDERVRRKFLEPISATGVMARETQERAHPITHPAAMAAWGVGLTPAQERRGPRLQSGNSASRRFGRRGRAQPRLGSCSRRSGYLPLERQLGPSQGARPDVIIQGHVHAP